MVSRVYEICDRYESGFGHGIKNDGLDLSKTLHGDAELGEAYQIGYEAGFAKFKLHASGKEHARPNNVGVKPVEWDIDPKNACNIQGGECEACQ